MPPELFPTAGSDGYYLLKGTAMKLRKVLAVTSAALIGVTSVGVAQAGPRDGHRGDRHYSGDRHGGHHGHHRNHRGGSDNSLAIALGIGLIGAVIASQAYSQSYAQPYGYAPGYNSNYGYQYGQPRNYGYAQPGFWNTPRGY
jgi:hypothetical protein